MPDDGLRQLFAELATADVPVPAPASVLARSRQRRHRARLRAAIAGVAVAALLAGAVELTGLYSGASPSTSRGGPRAMCAAAPESALSAALRRELNVGSQQDVSPIALASSGAVLYAVTTTQGFHGLAEVSVRTGAILAKLAQLPARFAHAQGGLGPAGEVVWMNTMSGSGQGIAGTSAMQLWSPRTGTMRALEPQGQRGDALSPPAFSGTDHDLAAWEQADGSTQEIVEANLATGITDVIARGYVGPPVFVGTALVWPVAPGAANAFVPGRDPQSPSHLVAADAEPFPAHGLIAVPRALREAGAATTIASDGNYVAYASPDLMELYFSSSPSLPARPVFRLRVAGNALSPGGLAFGAGFLSWSTELAASYLASTSSLAVAVIPGFSGITAVGDGVIITTSTGPKIRRQMHLYVITGSAISALKCTPAGH